MKKIKYGNRDKTKEKRNPFIEGLKQDEDDVCGAVLNSLNNDYLTYISDIVKASKTPYKMRTQQRIDQLFENKDKIKSKAVEIKQLPISMINKHKSKDTSPERTPKASFDVKNSTMPMKNIKELSQGGHELGQIRKQRQKSAGSVFEKTSCNPLKLDKNFNLKEHYNRFPTQEAEKPSKQQKFDLTSIACSDSSDHVDKNSKRHEVDGKQFIDGLEEYLITLESNRNFKRPLSKHQGGLRLHENSSNQIRQIQEVMQENLKLRKKVRMYEQKIGNIEQSMQNHFQYFPNNIVRHCKKQQKSNKVKINDLTQALLRAVSKIDQQRNQIEHMRHELRSFGRKAQFYVQKYDNDSDQDNEIIRESLMKAMTRPSRASSEYKLKRGGTHDFEHLIMDRKAE